MVILATVCVEVVMQFSAQSGSVVEVNLLISAVVTDRRMFTERALTNLIAAKK